STPTSGTCRAPSATARPWSSKSSTTSESTWRYDRLTMRALVLLGAILLALLALGGLPASGAGPGRLFLPLVAREVLPPLHIQYRAFSEEGGWSAWQDEGGIAGI